MTDTKTCPRCRQDKPLSEYHKDSSRPSGLQVYCKVCMRANTKAYADTNRARGQYLHRDAKVCGRCRQAKPPSAFSPDRGKRDGLHGWCKDCMAAHHRHRG